MENGYLEVQPGDRVMVFMHARASREVLRCGIMGGVASLASVAV